VIELLEIRMALECHALRLAIPAMGEMDLEAATRSCVPTTRSPIRRNGHLQLEIPRDALRGLQSSAPACDDRGNYGHVSRFTRALVSQATGKERPQRSTIVARTVPRREIKKAVGCCVSISRNAEDLRSAQRHVLRDASAASSV